MSESTDQYNKNFKKVEAEAGLLGHRHSSRSKGLLDIVSCSCGWQSEVQVDGMQYALDFWLKHAESEITVGQVVMNF